MKHFFGAAGHLVDNLKTILSHFPVQFPDGDDKQEPAFYRMQIQTALSEPPLKWKGVYVRNQGALCTLQPSKGGGRSSRCWDSVYCPSVCSAPKLFWLPWDSGLELPDANVGGPTACLVWDGKNGSVHWPNLKLITDLESLKILNIRLRTNALYLSVAVSV